MHLPDISLCRAQWSFVRDFLEYGQPSEPHARQGCRVLALGRTWSDPLGDTVDQGLSMLLQPGTILALSYGL